MGLSYAPFETEPLTKPPVYDPLNFGQVRKKVLGGPAQMTMDSTECNWIVLFFVVGVFLLALTDSHSVSSK